RFLREEFLAGSETVGLEEESEDNRAVRCDGLMAVSGRPPHELAGAANAPLIFHPALRALGLFQRGGVVPRGDRGRIELEQRSRDAVMFGIEHLDADAGKTCLPPRHVGDVEIT